MQPGRRLSTRKKNEVLAKIATRYYYSRRVAERTADRILERHPFLLDSGTKRNDPRNPEK